MRVIIHSAQRGTFLDYNGFFGWAFFSGDAGQISAIVKAKQAARTFASEADARAYIENLSLGYSDAEADACEPIPTDLAFVQVDTVAEYAPIEACVAAGVPRWDAPEVQPIPPFKFDFHAGHVGHTVVYGRTRSGKSVIPVFAKLLATTRT